MPKSLNSPRHVVLRNALIAQRRAVGMTQAQVAAAIGHPQSYISKIESGERRLDLVELMDIADTIGLDVQELVARLREVAGR